MEGKIGKSDHEIISFELWIDEKRTKSQRKSLNYKRANFMEMRAEMNRIDLRAVMHDLEVNDVWLYIKDILNELIKKHIPVHKSRVIHEPPWMNKNLKKKIEEKKGAWNRWKKTKRETDRENYRRKEKEVKKM